MSAQENLKLQVPISRNCANNIINMIDICTKRGAFDGSELLTVGLIRKELADAVSEQDE